MQFASDLHSIATNLDSATLQEIAKQLANISMALACLVVVSLVRFLFEGTRLVITMDQRRQERIEAETCEN